MLKVGDLQVYELDVIERPDDAETDMNSHSPPSAGAEGWKGTGAESVEVIEGPAARFDLS